MIERSGGVEHAFRRQPASEDAEARYEAAPIMGGLYGDGILGLKAGFSTGWVDNLGEEIARLYREALGRPGGAVGRCRNRYYVEIHPEDISGFRDLVTHPWIQFVSEAVLGPDYKIV